MKRILQIVFCITLFSVFLFVSTFSAYAVDEKQEETTTVVTEQDIELPEKELIISAPELNVPELEIENELLASSEPIHSIDDIYSILRYQIFTVLGDIKSYLDTYLENIWQVAIMIYNKLNEEPTQTPDSSETVTESNQEFECTVIFSVGFIAGIMLLKCFSFWKW